jgi:hypothetical protein
VTAADNAAGLPLAQQSQPACDAVTQQKERDLGALCADTTANGTSFFWTAMLKSGAMNVSERGRLCGLWCAHKDPDCNTAAAAIDAGAAALAPATGWTDANYIMRQPRVVQQWSTPDGTGGWQGSFYGTLDEQADLAALPTPAELIAQALAPWLFGLALARWGLGSLYLSAAVGVAMVGALMMLRARIATPREA